MIYLKFEKVHYRVGIIDCFKKLLKNPNDVVSKYVHLLYVLKFKNTLTLYTYSAEFYTISSLAQSFSKLKN